MADSVRAALRERLRLRTVLVWFGFLAFIFWFLDSSTLQLGMALASASVFGFLEILTEAYNLRSEVESLGLGLVTLLGGVSLFVFGGSNSDMGAAVTFVLIGSWLVLDAIQMLRHESWKDTDDHGDRDGHEVYREYVVKRVDEELRERALTRRELGDELDADDTAIDHALDVLTERGLLSRNGSELRVSSPPRPGALERARSGIAAPLARLARPLTIEFADETAGGDARPRPVEEAVSESKREREREST
jgi:hypothetical protein